MTQKKLKLSAKYFDPFTIREFDLPPLDELDIFRDVIKDTEEKGKPGGLDIGGGGWMSEEDIQDITDAEEYLYQQSVSGWFRPGGVIHVPADEQPPRQAKSRPDLFPPKALQLAGQVLAFGEAKHPDEKWKGMTSADHIGACWRHMLEHQAGNTYDSESGELHLAHAFVRLGMALDQYLGFR